MQKPCGAFSKVAADVTEHKQTEERLELNPSKLLTLYEAGQILTSSPEYEEIGSQLLQIVRRTANPVAALVSLRDERGDARVLQASGPEELRGPLAETPEVREMRQTVAKTGQLRTLRLESSGMGRLPPVGLCLPLLVHNDSIGTLEVYGRETLAERNLVALLINLASQAGSALENARLNRELAERERRLERLVSKLTEAHEEEHRKVAYEVHDGLAQLAVAAHQRLQSYAWRHPPSSQQAADDLDRALQLVHRTVREARRIIAKLRPKALDDFGLVAAIRLEVEELRSAGYRVDYREELGEEPLPTPLETVLFRVAQEALTNTRKHAQTDRLRLVLQRREDVVRLRVRDWGRGFDLAAVDSGGGPGERVGLSGMQERIAIIGGELEVRSRPGEGTSITAWIPLQMKGEAGPENADPGYSKAIHTRSARRWSPTIYSM